jgi:hypothetical protein
MHYARSQSAEVVGILGFDGGQAAELADVAIIVPSFNYGVSKTYTWSSITFSSEHFRAKLAEERPWVV